MEEFTDFVNAHPSIDDLASYVSQNYWGDGDDVIYHLENIDTGEILYSKGEYYEYDEDYDW